MGTQTNVDLGFPLRLYSLGCEPEPGKSINYHSKTNFLEEVEKSVGKEVWDYIRASPFGVIVQFVEKKFNWSSKLVEYLLVRQLVSKKMYEIWCLFGSTPARFSLSEFENITTLNCEPFPKADDSVEANAHKDLWEKMKVNPNKNPSKFQLKEVCKDVVNWSSQDKIRFAYLSILATVIVGNDGKTKLPSSLARMVFDLVKFEKYPWGRVAFMNLIKSVKSVELEADSYTIHGFIQVLQIWAYNVVPSLGSQIGHPSNSESFPLLKFSGKSTKRNIDIDAILVDNEDKIQSVIINESAPIFWDDEMEDNSINTLMQAISKGGLRIVTWIEQGSKRMQKEVNGDVEKDKGDGNVQKTSLQRQQEKKTNGRKRKISIESKAQISSTEVDTFDMLRLRIEQLEKQATSTEAIQAQMKDMSNHLKNFETIQLKSFETLSLRIEQLEKQATNIEATQAQMKGMANQFKSLETMQLQSLETMHSKLELLEKEVKILKDKSTTGENRRTKIRKSLEEYKLRDSSEEEMPIGEIFATLNAIKQKAVESDGESTVDGLPVPNNCKEPVKESSPIKILKPTVSLTEKFTQKKFQKTINAMGINNAIQNGREKSTRVTKPAAPLKTPFRSTNLLPGLTKKVIQPLTLVGRGYDPFSPVDVQ